MTLIQTTVVHSQPKKRVYRKNNEKDSGKNYTKAPNMTSKALNYASVFSYVSFNSSISRDVKQQNVFFA